MKAALALLIFGVASVLPSPMGDSEFTLIPDEIWFMELLSSHALREKPENMDFPVNFYLFTKRNPTTEQILATDDVSTLRKSNFDASHPTRILCHGWQGSRNAEMNDMIRDKYLARGNFNIIVVDWSAGADTLDYVLAACSTMPAGQKVGAFIAFLAANGNLKTDSTYLIGHSLGAHVVGIAGKLVTHGKINTIFGLDPAFPLFSIEEPDKRLAKGDALYVESIQTGGGVTGFKEPIGDATFYPNGGRNQPGCGLDLTTACSHARSYIYFAESLEAGNKFLTTKCHDYTDALHETCGTKEATARMGGDPSNYGRGVKGIYYLKTNSESPYATGLI